MLDSPSIRPPTVNEDAPDGTARKSHPVEPFRSQDIEEPSNPRRFAESLFKVPPEDKAHTAPRVRVKDVSIFVVVDVVNEQTEPECL
jgi:hypothetical protein